VHETLNDVLANLTPAQREAVTHVKGPLLILAGPGSGKTRVVTHRIGYLLQQGIPAREILALTFTNKAADEIRARVANMAPEARVWMSTFHRFCARVLREHAPLVGLPPNFVIYDTSDSGRVLRRALEEIERDLTRFTPDRIAAAISTAKNALITPETYEPKSGSPLGAIVADVYPLYQARLLACGAVDFDDLLLHVVTLLRDNPELRAELDERYRYILVDEYQDTNLAQYTIVRCLSIDHPNLAVTGDPDQSIYGWRGANLRNILDFEHDYPQVRVVRLEQNYRSTQRILRVADALISNNRQRKPKRLFTHNDEGTSVRLVNYAHEGDEAQDIVARIAAAVRSGRRRPREYAIFYRVNALSRPFEAALRAHGLAFQIVNGVEFYQRKEVKDILAYLSLLNNPRDDVAFLRIVNSPARGIGKSTLQRLQDFAGREGMTLLEAARVQGSGGSGQEAGGRRQEAGTLNSAAAKKLAKFAEMIERLGQLSHRPVEEILGHVLSETAYDEQYRDSESEEDQERLANIQELLTAARQFDERHGSLSTDPWSSDQTAPQGGLEGFLEESCLVNDTDRWEVDTDRVTLMTMHAAKGLEFPVVYIVALEQGLIPHERSKDHPEQLEEERRLLFVAITRAREELQLSLARRRMFRGQNKSTVPSPFLHELPREELDWQERHTETQLIPEEAALAAAGPNRRRTATPAQEARLLTGVELENGQGRAAPSSSPLVSADDFAQGMVVIHPEYGLGKIIALSGVGEKRKATVAFATGAGQKIFLLAHSALRPVGNNGR
jgi:DNA helicase-2/ATP-dependent DNA helicase PcrA